MIQSQQSFAQQQDKVAVCKWRYKHSLTALECHEYASKTKQLQDTFIVCHAVTCIFDDDDATIGIFSTLSSLWIVHNFIWTFPAMYTVRWWMSTSSATSIKNKQEELKNFELGTLDFVFSQLQLLYLSFCQFSFNAYLAVSFFFIIGRVSLL